MTTTWSPCPTFSGRSSTPRPTSGAGRSTARRRRSEHSIRVRFDGHPIRFEADNALPLIAEYDLILDGSDNFATRYLVPDACFLAGKPLISGSLDTFDGTLTTIRAHERGPDGELNPTYRCLFREPPPPGLVPACAEAGVLGALLGMLGSTMALEAIREIVGFGEGLVRRLPLIDTLTMRLETLRYQRDPDNPLNGDTATIADLQNHCMVTATSFAE